MKAARPVREGADGKVLRATGVTRRRPTLHTQGGTAVTQLRLATERRRQDGETEADWHNVVVWSKQAEAVNEYVGKGDDGQRRYRTEIHASEVVFLDSRGGNGGKDNGDASDIEEPVAASPF